MISKIKLVVFDLDGTLIDSVPDLAYCIDRMMERLGRPPQGEERVRQWVGNGVERLVKRALTGEMDGEPRDCELQEAYPVFLDLYCENTSKRSVLYPGVQEGLDYLRTAGYHLACVTNKAAQFTDPLVRDLGIKDYFGLVISGDSLPRRKPDPLPLLYAAQHFGVEPRESLMVGDSMSDVKAARAAKFTIVCVSYGYNHGVDIRLSQPDDIIDSLEELEDVLENAPSFNV